MAQAASQAKFTDLLVRVAPFIAALVMIFSVNLKANDLQHDLDAAARKAHHLKTQLSHNETRVAEVDRRLEKSARKARELSVRVADLEFRVNTVVPESEGNSSHTQPSEDDSGGRPPSGGHDHNPPKDHKPPKKHCDEVGKIIKKVTGSCDITSH